MKKISAVILTLALFFMTSVTAFAANKITAVNGSDSAIVKGTYNAGSAAATVYSVDITWGSMDFTYTDASTGTRDPATHQYDNISAAKWSCSEGADKISVTNHSNAGITVKLGYEQGTGYNGISGSFSDNKGIAITKLTLGSAVGTKPESAPSASAVLGLNGELSSDNTTATAIGKVTVTLVND